MKLWGTEVRRLFPKWTANAPCAMGAARILEHCLTVRSGNELAIVFDESTADVAGHVVNAALDIRANAIAVFFPIRMQALCSDPDYELPGGLSAALSSASHVLTCVTDNFSCLAFRNKIVDLAHRHPVRVGHMPGAMLPLLIAGQTIDFAKQSQRCLDLCVPMIGGRTALLETRSHDGTAHVLRLSLGGWTRLPSPSDGVIQEGSWGNTPGGEAYIAPLEGSANGTFVVSGSIPGHALAPGEEVRLVFTDGRLSGWTSASRKCRRILRNWIEFAREQADENWSNLAELGIGATQDLHELTGHPLIDEKVGGTAHIALGHSRGFGGTVASSIHIDLVTKDPSLEIDGHTVLSRGRLRAREWSSARLSDFRSRAPVPPTRRVGLDPSATAQIVDGALNLHWMSPSMKSMGVQLGAFEDACIAAKVYMVLKDHGPVTSLARLSERVGLPLAQTTSVYLLLRESGLLLRSETV